MSFDIRTSLSVRVEASDPATDLLGAWTPGSGFFFEHARGGVVGVDAAAVVTVAPGPDQVGRGAALARELLERCDGETIIVGAFPFDGRTPAVLTVPRLTLRRLADGRIMRITVGGPCDVPAFERVEHARAEVRTSPVPEPEAYVEAVKLARERIAAGELDKVVLARMLVAHADHDFDRRALLARLRDTEPDAFVFAAGGFIGATPELLVRRLGEQLETTPLAGTAPRGTGSSADEAAARALLASSKDRAEHALVVDAVRAALTPVCSSLDVPAEPVTVCTSKVWHLATPVLGRLCAPAPDALALVARLHPTPAVCGTPTHAAMTAIAELERIDRTLYAGAVGWMDSRGDGEWAVALRCAEVRGRMAMLFAGAGIVADSDPDAELAETDAKFRAMLDALGYA